MVMKKLFVKIWNLLEDYSRFKAKQKYHAWY